MRQEMMGFGDGSGISWTICKQSAPRSRQTTTPTPHHSISNLSDEVLVWLSVWSELHTHFYDVM